MTVREACEVTDEMKRGFYIPRTVRQRAVETLQGEHLNIHGQWRDNEISLRSRLNQQEIIAQAIDILQNESA